MGEDESNKLKRYEVIRDYIKHEDTLINNRLTWLLVSQGFIFSAFSGLFKPMADIAFKMGDPSFEKNKVALIFDDLEKLQYVLIGLGLLICIISYLAIEGAIQSIDKVKDDHNHLSQDICLPELTGGGNPIAKRFGIVSSRGIPIILFLAWIIVILIRLTHL